MERVMVVGAGFMGTGIAQVCAQSGYRVHLMDTQQEAVDHALDRIKWSTTKLFDKGILKEPPEQIIKRISPEQEAAVAADSQWIIEAIPEIEALKKEIFRDLDRLSSQETILATNTSSIPITRIAEVVEQPERVIGLHFFGPVPFMGLVEVVMGEKTSTRVFDRGVAFIRSLGKTPVRVHQDIPGFVMNRIFSAAFREAVDLVAQGIVSPEDVDEGMKLGYGWNAGPFEIADNAGLDTFALVGRSMMALGEKELVSQSGLVEKMVKEGRTGRKAGKGFYRYDEDGNRK